MPQQLENWKLINKIIAQRKEDGIDEHHFGKVHLFISSTELKECDYQETIDKGADMNLYGKY
jgi:hypothetical protein